jgi:hypothetical protein
MNIFFDTNIQNRLQKNLQHVLLTLMKEAQAESSFFRKSYENRRDITLSSISNLSSGSNDCWRQSLSIIKFASTLYLALLLAELPQPAASASASTPTPLGAREGLKELAQKRLSIIATLVEGFPVVDEDNVTCVDLWLKCAFWSTVLSKIQYLLEYNVGGKGAALKRVFASALADAAAAAAGGATDLFSIWAGILSTACLQPKILSEIGFWPLHRALHSPAILHCIPAKKYAFLSRCFVRMKSMREVDVDVYMTSQRMAEPVVDGNSLSVRDKTAAAAPEVASSVDWQLLTLHKFAVVAAVHLHELRPEERSDVKEKQLKPLLDMLHRCLFIHLSISLQLCVCVPL